MRVHSRVRVRTHALVRIRPHSRMRVRAHALVRIRPHSRMRIRSCVWIRAHSLVRVGFKVPPGTLVAGVPATVKRYLKPAELDEIKRSAERYAEYARSYRSGLKAV